MSYAVKEIFYTLQGEGAQTGRPSVFCRFAGCNLWSGREADRAGAICSFCDTNFVGTDGTGGGRYPSAVILADRIAAHWPEDARARFVVCLDLFSHHCPSMAGETVGLQTARQPRGVGRAIASAVDD